MTKGNKVKLLRAPSKKKNIEVNQKVIKSLCLAQEYQLQRLTSEGIEFVKAHLLPHFIVLSIINQYCVNK